MFKKSILAVAIASVVSPSMAATFVTAAPAATKVIHTLEGIAGSLETTGVANTTVRIALGAEYALNDTITLTNSVAKSTNYNWATAISTIASGRANFNTDGSAYATIVSAMITATNTGIVVGDRFTIAGDTTIYTALTVPSSTTLTFSPKIAKAIAAAATAITVLDGQVNFGLISSTDTTGTYRVTSTAGTSTHIGAAFTTPAVALSPAGLTVQANTIGFAAATATGVAMDALATTHTTASTVAEYKFTVGTKFDGIVDVENDRKILTATTTLPDGIANTTSNLRDTMIYTLAEATGTAGKVWSDVAASTTVAAVTATTTSSVLTLAGDFTYLDSTPLTATVDLTAPANVINAATTANAQVGVNAIAADKITVTGANGNSWLVAANAELVLTSGVTTNVIPTQTYTPSFSIGYTSAVVAQTKKVLSAAGGAWVLNGASVTAYAVPFGAAVQRFTWVGNAGATDAVVSATVTGNGTAYGPYQLGTVAAKTQMKVNLLIDDALTTAGVTVDWSRADILLTAPVKAANITVNSSYKHIADADRLTLDTSDTIDGTTK